MITAATLRRIATMPEQAMAEALLFLAEQLEEQEAKRASHALRQRRYRDAHRDVTVTSSKHHCDAGVTSLARVEYKTLPSSQEESKTPSVIPPASSKPLPPDEPEGFPEFWNIYPKRLGTADRKGAVKAFRAALRRTDLQTIIDGTRAYVADCKASNKTGTEFVKQARSWLNGDLWTEFQPKPQELLSPNGKVYVKQGTDAWDAWDIHYRIVKHKPPPHDTKGGWWFPSEFPETEKVTQ